MTSARAKSLLGGVALAGLAAVAGAGAAEAFSFCSYHDRPFAMRAYHNGPSLYADLAIREAVRWNAVHSVLRVERVAAARVPARGDDGISVVTFLSEYNIQRLYGLSFVGVAAWTVTRKEEDCGRITQADILVNPALTLTAPQTRVPYRLDYQEVVLHELGHVLGLGHEDDVLSVMTAGAAVGNALYRDDKVGWRRAADFRLSPVDRADIGVFPLRNSGTSKVYATLSAGTAARGSTVQVRDVTVQNLSTAIPVTGVVVDLRLERAGAPPVAVGAATWATFRADSSWSGNLSLTVPAGAASGTYDVVGAYRGSDTDRSNDRAVFGTLRVR